MKLEEMLKLDQAYISNVENKNLFFDENTNMWKVIIKKGNKRNELLFEDIEDAVDEFRLVNL